MKRGLRMSQAAWLSLSVVIALFGCANPKLSYVELANRPDQNPDGGVDLGLEQTGSSQSGSGTNSTAGEFIEPPTGSDGLGNNSKSDAGNTDSAGSLADGSLASDANLTTSDATGPQRGPSGEQDAALATPKQDADTNNGIICDCPADVNPCVKALCLAGLTICTLTPLPGAECDDGNPCTQADNCDESGSCGGTPKDCSNEDGVCVEGVCNEDNGTCEAKPSAANTPCDDDNRCSVDDVCDGDGVCEGQPRDCSALDSSCAQGSCAAETGECVALPVNEGEKCDDDNKCTGEDVCSDDGVCRGQAVDCSDQSGVCAVGVCDPQDGRCRSEPLSGVACDDGDDCTTLDTCDDGECQGREADDCGDAGWLDLSSGSASVIMSNDCANDDFDVRSHVPDDSDCVRSSGDDVVFILDLSQFTDTVTVRASTAHDETEFDTVLFLTNQECSEDALIACVDDADDSFASELEVRVNPGVYALVVDAYKNNEEGKFRLDVVVQ